ncbi:MAG: signal peptidase II [Chloroflexi bacterium]|nr:signal peptidase II [Chloroflexota bacterium]
MERVETSPSAPVQEDAPDVHTRQARLFASVAIGAIVADQATKALIRAWLAEGETWPAGFELIRLSHVENTGAAFGILQGAGPLLVISSIVGVVVVLVLLYTAPAGDRLYTAALALVLGGAVGNLIDRVLRGEVTDFIDPTHYPAFNLADSSIVVGVIALILLSFRPQPPPDEGTE